MQWLNATLHSNHQRMHIDPYVLPDGPVTQAGTAAVYVCVRVHTQHRPGGQTQVGLWTHTQSNNNQELYVVTLPLQQYALIPTVWFTVYTLGTMVCLYVLYCMYGRTVTVRVRWS